MVLFQALGSVLTAAEHANCRHPGGERFLDSASLTPVSATSHSSLSPEVPEKRMGSIRKYTSDEWNAMVWTKATVAYTEGIQQKRKLEALEAHDQELLRVKRICR